MTANKRPMRYITPDRLPDANAGFGKFYGGSAVTHGEFTIDIPSLKSDLEWNYMDQLHRPYIHHTYSDSLRIALNPDFSLSLTRWGRWPFLIPVTDVRIGDGLFYQIFVLFGLIYVHNVNDMKVTGDIVHLKVSWTINSHRLLKPLHWLLNRSIYRLNVRLQPEDEPIRSQRFRLRKLGYNFRSDPPDFYTSNMLTPNTLYPDLPPDASIALAPLPLDEMAIVACDKVEFLIRRQADHTLVWPAACPHEGGELAHGKLGKDCRLECPWHGMKFAAARLSENEPTASAHGFSYRLAAGVLHVTRMPGKSEAGC